MRNLVILDLDGVMITTPSWRSDEIGADGYSEFNVEAVSNLNALMKGLDAELWLSSTRRLKKTLTEFNEIFKMRKIESTLEGFLPASAIGTRRNIEIDQFLDNQSISNFLILDDDQSLQGLEQARKECWIQTDPLVGFNSDKLEEAKMKIEKWT